MNTNKGTFIAIDGLDGSGKTIQTSLLKDRLLKQKRAVEVIDFPRYDTNFLGKLLRECLDGKHGDFIAIGPKIASVIYAADRFESSPKMRQWLAEGKVLVSNRYVSANQIHQGGKITDSSERKKFLLWLDTLEHEIFGIPRPNVVIYLDVPVDVSVELARVRAAQKGESPDTAESNILHQRQSQDSALSIIKQSNNWLRIDCAPNGKMLLPAEIHDKVFEAVKHLL